MHSQTALLLAALALAATTKAYLGDDNTFEIYTRGTGDDLGIYGRELEHDLVFLAAREASPDAYADADADAYAYANADAEAEAEADYYDDYFPLTQRSMWDSDDDLLDILVARWAEAEAEADAEADAYADAYAEPEPIMSLPPGGNRGGKSKNKSKSKQKCAVFVDGKCAQFEGGQPNPSVPAPSGPGAVTNPMAAATTTKAAGGWTEVNQAGW